MEILLPVDSMLPVLCPDSVDLTDVTAARAGDRHAEAHIASVLRTEYEALAPIEAIDGSAQHFVVSPAIPDPPESLETDIERLKGLMREGEYDAAQALVDRASISEPWLLNPNRFIRALSFSSLNILGLGFPSCLFGVTVPTSTKP